MANLASRHPLVPLSRTKTLDPFLQPRSDRLEFVGLLGTR